MFGRHIGEDTEGTIQTQQLCSTHQKVFLKRFEKVSLCSLGSSEAKSRLPSMHIRDVIVRGFGCSSRAMVTSSIAGPICRDCTPNSELHELKYLLRCDEDLVRFRGRDWQEVIYAKPSAKLAAE